MPRLFVALRPPPAIRARLADTMAGVPGARWQDDEQLHLTLRFLGEVGRHQAEDVAAAIAGVHAAAPLVRLAGVGRFADRGRATALWAGIAPPEPLAHLHRKVDQACGRAGLAPEHRAYKPHVTLARFSRSAGYAPEIDRWLADHAALAGPAFAFEHLLLYESHLGGEGARYEPLARWPLAAPAAMPAA